MMEDTPKDPSSLPSYYFETPSAEPDPELLALLPEKSIFEQIVDFGLYFVALFQVFLFVLFLYIKIIKKFLRELHFEIFGGKNVYFLPKIILYRWRRFFNRVSVTVLNLTP